MKNVLRRHRRAADATAQPPMSQAALAGESRWKGFIDFVERTLIVGWAYDRENPGRSVPIEAVASDGRRVGAIASKYRQDVKDAGHGTGLYGFEIDVAVLELKNESVTVRFVDSHVVISTHALSIDPQRSLLEDRLPPAYTDAMRLLALDVRAQHAKANTGYKVRSPAEAAS